MEEINIDKKLNVMMEKKHIKPEAIYKVKKICNQISNKTGVKYSDELLSLCTWEVLNRGDFCISRSEVCEMFHVKTEDMSRLAKDIVDKKIGWKNEVLVKEEILDVLAILHQDRTLMADAVINFLKRCLLKNIEMKYSKPLVAFAIWEILNQNGCPHSKQEIGYLCDVSPAEINRIAKESGISPTFCNVASFAFRFTSMLGLSRNVGALVHKIVNVYTNSLHLPETIIAAVILNIQHYMRVHFNLQFSPKISLKRLSTSLHVSENSILKFANENRLDHVNLIEIYIESFVNSNKKDVQII